MRGFTDIPHIESPGQFFLFGGIFVLQLLEASFSAPQGILYVGCSKLINHLSSAIDPLATAIGDDSELPRVRSIY